MKGGCGFYVRSDLTFKPRTDLDIRFHNENNEFQSKWIEILFKQKKENLVIAVFYGCTQQTSLMNCSMINYK